MEGLFRQIGIYSRWDSVHAAGRGPAAVLPRGQEGQILEEGINEGGAMCSWIAAGTAYANTASA